MSQRMSIGDWLLSSSRWAILNKLLTTCAAFIVNALITRLLIPEDVGAYYLMFGIVAFLLLICGAGTQQGVVRLVSASMAGSSEVSTRGALYTCFIICGIPTIIVAFLYASHIGPLIGESIVNSQSVAELSVITAIWLLLRSIQSLFAQSLRGFKRVDLASTFEGTLSGLTLVGLLGSLYIFGLNVSLEQVIACTVLALTAAVAVSGFFLSRVTKESTGPANQLCTRYAISICAPLFVASLCLQGFNELHIGLLGYFSEEQEVAKYGAAFRLAKFVIVPLVIVNSVIPPIVSQLYHTSQTKEAEKLLRITATISSIPTILIVGVILVFGEQILALVYGDYYREGAGVLIILLTGQLVNSITGSPGILLAMANEQRVVMMSALFSGITGILLSMLLAAKFSSVGVATGVAVSLASHNLLMWAFSLKRLGIKTHLKPSDFVTLFNALRDPTTLAKSLVVGELVTNNARMKDKE